MLTRATIVLALMLAAAAYVSSAARPEAPVPRTELASLPLTLDTWRGYATPPLPDDVLAELGVDDYVNRRYMRDGGIPVSVYVGYYASQRQGDTIHSPQNCLPGAGWQPLDSGRARVTLPDRSVDVNRYLIGKGLDRQMVLYWYQGRNRVVANEYTNKVLLMLDAASRHRTNGGLVRLVAPVTGTTDAALAELIAFARVLLPRLEAYLP
jgi:EpsI family protein